MENGERESLAPDKLQPFSLLWPKAAEYDEDANSFALDETAVKDLELERLFRRIAGDDRRFMEIERLLRKVSFDPEAIVYRQDILGDLIDHPELAACLEKILPDLETFKRGKSASGAEKLELYELTGRLSELESFVRCVTMLDEAFRRLGSDPRSEGMLRLRELAVSYRHDELFGNLMTELPDLLERLRGIRSVSIGVNLDVNLLPFQATLLSVNEERYSGKSSGVFNSLFPNASRKNEGIAQLHEVPPKNLGNMDLDSDTHGYSMNPLMVPLFRDLDAVIRKTTLPINRALQRYVSVNTSLLGDLKRDIVFYLCSVKMLSELGRSGLPFCKPAILPCGERRTEIKRNYNINLAIALGSARDGSLGAPVVMNDVRMGPEGRSFVITGPNRGGKTTYTQAIGLSHVMAQLGLLVPGTEAAISPVDGVFTHFPNEEKIDRGTGRLGDEAMRIASIFSALTDRSLVLFNESLSSTNTSESFYIARDILRVLCALGTRAVFTTHMYELASAVDEINSSVSSGEKVLSLVASVSEEPPGNGTKEISRTFRILPGKPAGNSYAREIAERYGVSFGQLSDRLRERGLME